MAASHIDFTLDKLRRFKFTLRTGRELEQAARNLGATGVLDLISRGSAPDTVTLLTCYGLKHEETRMTESKAEDLVQTYIDNGGEVEVLFEQLLEAMTVSGLYKNREQEKKASGDANPSQA